MDGTVYSIQRTRKGLVWIVNHEDADGNRHQIVSTAHSREEAEVILWMKNRERIETILSRKLAVLNATRTTPAPLGVVRSDTTFGQFLRRDFTDFCRAHHMPDTLEKELPRIERLANRFDNVRPDALLTGDITRFSDQRRIEGVKPSTINSELSILSRAIREAKERGLIKHDNLPRVRLFKIPKRCGARYTREETAALLRVAGTELRLALRFFLNSGLRFSQVLRLIWEQVDLERKTLRVVEKKGGQERERFLPLNTEAMTVLTSLERRVGEPRVFWMWTPNSLRYALQSALKAADLPAVGKQFHAFRRTFATKILNTTGSRAVAAALLGHSDEKTLRLYGEIEDQTARGAVEGIVGQQSTGNVSQNNAI